MTPQPGPREADALRLDVARGLFFRREYELAGLTLKRVKLPEFGTQVDDLTRRIEQAAVAP